jgi:hypothetical protein
MSLTLLNAGPSISGGGGGSVTLPSWGNNFNGAHWVGNAGTGTTTEPDQITTLACDLPVTGTNVNQVAGPNGVGFGRQGNQATNGGFRQNTLTAKMLYGSTSFVWYGWLNPSTVATNMIVWLQNNFEIILVTAGSVIQSKVTQTTQSSQTVQVAIVANVWSFILTTFDATNSALRISINGANFTSVGSASPPAGIPTNVQCPLLTPAASTLSLADWGFVKASVAIQSDVAAMWNGGNGLTNRNGIYGNRGP